MFVLSKMADQSLAPVLLIITSQSCDYRGTAGYLRDLPSKTGNRYSFLAGRAGKYGGMNWKI